MRMLNYTNYILRILQPIIITVSHYQGNDLKSSFSIKK